TKARDEAIGRFKATGARSPKGAKLLGRWTAADFSGGFDLLESDDVKALTEVSLMWSDLMGLKIVPVVEGSGLGEVLSRLRKEFFGRSLARHVIRFLPPACVLDVGGGTAPFLVAVLRRYDALKGMGGRLPIARMTRSRSRHPRNLNLGLHVARHRGAAAPSTRPMPRWGAP